jgi:hypothetical protein
VVATLFVLAYGVVTPWGSRHWWRHLVLALPIGVFICWSCKYSVAPFIRGPLDWAWWHMLGFFPAKMERLPCRFIVVPFALCATAACLGLQRKIEQGRGWAILGIVVLGVTLWDVQQHTAPLRAAIVAGNIEPPAANVFLLAHPADRQEFHTGVGAFALPGPANSPQTVTYDTVRYRVAIAGGLFLTLIGLMWAGDQILARRALTKYKIVCTRA